MAGLCQHQTHHQHPKRPPRHPRNIGIQNDNRIKSQMHRVDPSQSRYDSLCQGTYQTPTTTLLTTQQPSHHDDWYFKAITGPNCRRIMQTPHEVGMTAYAGACTNTPTTHLPNTQQQSHHDDRRPTMPETKHTPEHTTKTMQQPSHHDDWYSKVITRPSRRRIVRTP